MSLGTKLRHLWFRIAAPRNFKLRQYRYSNNRSGDTYQLLESRQLLAVDMVLQWNEVLLDAIRSAATPPPVASRAMAIVHTAIFDAVNSIDHSYQLYHSLAAVHPQASLDAAVAAAAERALSTLFPAQHAVFSAALTTALNAIPDGLRENQGVDVGRFVADKILLARSTDGSANVVNYTPGSDPGDWRPTPPAFSPGAFPQWPNVATWGLTSGSQFRPSGPPQLGSAEYAASLNQVKEIGSATSAIRTADQTNIAKVWAGGPGTATPPGQWNMIAQDLAVRQGNSLVENARLFALLNISLADAAISAWDCKYDYDYWRPITAIREAATDGNVNTIQDTTWTPLLTTPPFSSYTSGHSTFSGAASTILANFYGTSAISFVLKSEVSGVPDRFFTNLVTAADEAGLSRIYGGIHYNFDNVDALAAGRSIGNFVSGTQLRLQTNISALQSGNRLFIQGTTLDDKILVNQVGENLVVYQNGRAIAQFTASGIVNVVANGADGHDRIKFSSTVNATAEIFGGAGSDRIFGSNLGNWIYGEDGNDVLFGGRRTDVIKGGLGDDFLFGLRGDDTLDGDDGFDLLFGGADSDTLFGTQRKDKLFGGSGRDHLVWT